MKRWLWVWALSISPPAHANHREVAFALIDRLGLPHSEHQSLRREVSQTLAAHRLRGRDVSSMHRILFQPPMLLIDFQRKRPSGWPAALDEDWERGHAACAARLSDIAPVLRPARARECQVHLSKALFRRWLAHENLEQVIEITLDSERRRPDEPRALACAYFKVAENEGTVARAARVPTLDTAATVRRLVRSALQGGGERYRPALSAELPSPKAR